MLHHWFGFACHKPSYGRSLRHFSTLVTTVSDGIGSFVTWLARPEDQGQEFLQFPLGERAGEFATGKPRLACCRLPRAEEPAAESNRPREARQPRRTGRDRNRVAVAHTGEPRRPPFAPTQLEDEHI